MLSFKEWQVSSDNKITPKTATYKRELPKTVIGDPYNYKYISKLLNYFLTLNSSHLGDYRYKRNLNIFLKSKLGKYKSPLSLSDYFKENNLDPLTEFKAIFNYKD